MSNAQNPRNLSAYDGGGNESAPAAITGLVTLDVDDHYFPLPVEDGELASVHILTDGTIAGTFTIETSNFPRLRGDGTGPVDVADHDETTGNWVKENPTSAYVATVGTGWTVSALTLTKTAGAGAAMLHLGNLGSRRCRLKAAITTGGTLRVVAGAKS